MAKAVGYLKMNSSKQIREGQPSLVVWQRSFHDHVVRNETDCQDVRNYIDGNPGKRAEDRFFPAL